MPAKGKEEPGPPWGVILEETRSQNRATIEAVEVNRETLERRMGDLNGSLTTRMDDLERALTARLDGLEEALGRVDEESRARDASLDVAIRDLKVSVQQNSVDIRELAARVEALTRLEERVAALARRSA
jgi:SMC interacting uncharacterized protein involved in chromosome segregation